MTDLEAFVSGAIATLIGIAAALVLMTPATCP